MLVSSYLRTRSPQLTIRSLNDYWLAHKYFSAAAQFILGTHLYDLQDYVDEIPAPFGFGSIMIYSSAGFMVDSDNARFAGEHPIERQTTLTGASKIKSKNELYVFAAGNGGDPAKTRVSTWDIRRVAEPYPGTPTQQDRAARLGTAENWDPMVARIEDLVNPWMLSPNPLGVAYPNWKASGAIAGRRTGQGGAT